MADEDDIFNEENLAKDFDVEAFFDVKQENLEKGDLFAGANESLMDKYIEMMNDGPMLSPKVGVGPSALLSQMKNNSSALPPVHPG
jgi:hypothetical protein